MVREREGGGGGSYRFGGGGGMLIWEKYQYIEGGGGGPEKKLKGGGGDGGGGGGGKQRISGRWMFIIMCKYVSVGWAGRVEGGGGRGHLCDPGPPASPHYYFKECNISALEGRLRQFHQPQMQSHVKAIVHRHRI